MQIPIAQKNQIKKEVISCIIENGEDPEKCLVAAARNHGLSQQQIKEVADKIMEEADDN